jgi:hypothetical protein
VTLHLSTDGRERTFIHYSVVIVIITTTTTIIIITITFME